MRLLRSCFSYIFSREGWFRWNILQTGKSMHISETQPLFVPEYALGERSSLLLSRSFAFPLTSSLQPNNTLLPLPFSFFFSLCLSPFLWYPGICLMLTISALLRWKRPQSFSVSRSPQNLIHKGRDNLLSNASNSIVFSAVSRLSVCIFSFPSLFSLFLLFFFFFRAVKTYSKLFVPLIVKQRGKKGNQVLSACLEQKEVVKCGIVSINGVTKRNRELLQGIFGCYIGFPKIMIILQIYGTVHVIRL